jgi:hypothetical protein
MILPADGYDNHAEIHADIRPPATAVPCFPAPSYAIRFVSGFAPESSCGIDWTIQSSSRLPAKHLRALMPSVFLPAVSALSARLRHRRRPDISAPLRIPGRPH